MKKLFFYGILIFFICYGIYLRGYELSTGSFWIDEWYSSLIAYFITQNNFLPKLAGGMYEFSQYFFHLFQAFSFSFLWFSDFSARLPSFLLSLFFIVLYYIFSFHLTKEIRYKNVAVLFLMFLFLFSTWQIIWSREARFYEMLALFYLIVTFFLYKYIQTKREIYVMIFFIFLLIGLVFHHFFLAFIPIALVLFLYDFFSRKKMRPLLLLVGTVFLYGGIQIFLKKISGAQVSIWNVFPEINYLKEYEFFTFFTFYIQVLIEQLGVIFYFYLIGVLYFLFSKKWQEFLLFWWIFFINIIAISFWYFAHSRYIFHLFSIITLFWWYSVIMIWEYCIEKSKLLSEKIGVFVLLGAIFVSIIQTFQFTFLPQRFYYIDATSPKPNFKTTYEYIQATYPEAKIISWFPHMCFWYNREDPKKCEFALRVNLIGKPTFNQAIMKRTIENYTAVKYIDSISELDIWNYLFVLDDLTLKNSVDDELINEIKEKCYMFYRDVWNYEHNNFIWIWKCQ